MPDDTIHAKDETLTTTKKRAVKKPSLSEAAAASRRAHFDALNAEKQLRDERIAADGLPAKIRRSWANGNASYTAADLTTAEHNITRTVALHEAAKRAIAEARANLVNELPDLAQSVSAAFGSSINGIPITATVEKPEVPEQLPALFAVQTSPSTPADRNPGGPIAGTVELTLFRQTYVRPLEDVADNLPSRGIILSRAPRERTNLISDEVAVDVITLDILHAWAEVPVIGTETGENYLHYAGKHVADWVSSAGQRWHAPVKGIGGGAEMFSGSSNDQLRSIIATASDIVEPQQVIADDGTRTTTLHLKLHLSAGHSGIGINGLPAEAMSALNKTVNHGCIPYLGRLAGVRSHGGEPFATATRHGRTVNLELAFVSRLG